MHEVIIIGGGAAGFFAAISAVLHGAKDVVMFEKTHKLLAKVKISGGGRCNVTHACFDNKALVKNYPRGEKELREVFSKFSVADTIHFFESRGVKLKSEDDGRMFPVTDNSQSIIDCLMTEVQSLGIKIITGVGVQNIIKNENEFEVHLTDKQIVRSERVIVCTGGNPKTENYAWLKQTGHEIANPVPSLFTFNVPSSVFDQLQGVSVPHAKVSIPAYKLNYTGPILITHWGFSGPAVIKLSAWGARVLFDVGYSFRALINWTAMDNEEDLRQLLLGYKDDNQKKLIENQILFNLPKRLWRLLIELAGIELDLKWGDLSNKKLNKLIENLLRTEIMVQGKTTFKEEFVTAGGISLKGINMGKMESKLLSGLFFAGEVLDIDGITGGFNFQAAWSTGWLSGKYAALGLKELS